MYLLRRAYRGLFFVLGVALAVLPISAPAAVDINNAMTSHVSNYLNLPTFYSGWDSGDSTACIGNSHALHPSVQYFPDGLWGYRFWIAYTPICISESDENPHIAVSNDGVTFREFSLSDSVLANPLFEPGDFDATHLSDPDLQYDPATGLWLAFRVTWELAGLDSNGIFVTLTSDGLHWSEPTKILSDGLLGQSLRSGFLSPCLMFHSDGSHSVYVVEPHASGITNLDSSRVVRYHTAAFPSGLIAPDTCAFSLPYDSLKIWHLDILPAIDTGMVALVTLSPNGRANLGDSAELFLAQSYDGQLWETAAAPLLSWTADTTAWYGRFVYRSSGYWISSGERTILGVYYSAQARQVTSGGSGTGWQTGLTSICFGDDRRPLSAGLTIDGSLRCDHVSPSITELTWLYLDPLHTGAALRVDFELGTDPDWSEAETWRVYDVPLDRPRLAYGGPTLAGGAEYFGRLRTGNETDWSDWCEIAFHTNIAPTVPVLLSPLDTVVAGTRPKLWISNASDADNDHLQYEFTVRTYSSEDGLLPVAQSACNVSETPDSTGWAIPVALVENLRYAWKARAFDGCSYSDWTEPTLFYVNSIEEPPTAPVAVYPCDDSGAPLYDMRPTFTWRPSVDPDPCDSVCYRMELAFDSGFDNIVFGETLTDTCWILDDSLRFGVQHWWRICAVDKSGLSTRSTETPSFWTWTLGDIDRSHSVNLADITYLAAYLFQGGISPTPEYIADIDGSCQVNVADLAWLVATLFVGGPEPRAGCKSL